MRIPRTIRRTLKSATAMADADTIKRDLAEVQKIWKEREAAFKDKRGSVWATTRNKADSSRQVLPRAGSDTDTDPFVSELYAQHGLLEPRYPFLQLLDIVECSDMLQICIAIIVEGVDGNGHDFPFLGDDKERTTDENKAIHEQLKNFFDECNEFGSFANVRKAVRRDLEQVGNGAMEVIRNLAGGVEQLYHQPITYMRMTIQDKEDTPYTVKLLRNGKPTEVTRFKKFRRYARWYPSGNILWFKEFGDPRTVDRVTGQYMKTGETPPNGAANELWWFKLPFRNLDYGAPRWCGCIDVIRGRILASWCNYDLFNNQGIPPILFVVEGGFLTDGSLQELENTIESWRDPAQFNRTVVLQAIPAPDMGFGLKDGGSPKPTVKIEKLRDARNEEYMFAGFLAYSEGVIRRCWRIPPLAAGKPEDYNQTTSYASQQQVEQQVFAPIRSEFDEQIKLRIIRGEFGIWNYKFRSKGPRAGGAEELAQIMRTFALSVGPSSNQVMGVANELLGTDWSLNDAPAFKIPVALLLALTKLGRTHMDPEGNIIILTPRQALGQENVPGDTTPVIVAEQPAQIESSNVIPFQGKAATFKIYGENGEAVPVDFPSVEAMKDSFVLWQAMQEVHKEMAEYQAPVIQDVQPVL